MLILTVNNALDLQKISHMSFVYYPFEVFCFHFPPQDLLLWRKYSSQKAEYESIVQALNPLLLSKKIYLGNRPHFLLVYRRDNPRGMLGQENLVNHEPKATDLQASRVEITKDSTPTSLLTKRLI